MLPEFPKARKKMDELWEKALFAEMNSEKRFITSMPVRTQREGTKASFETVDGETTDLNYTTVSTELKLEVEDAKGMSEEQFFNHARSLGAGMADGMSKHMLRVLDTVTEETGNTFDFSAGKFGPDNYLEIIDHLAFGFEPDGRPEKLHFILPPSLHKEITAKFAEWQADPQFTARYKEIITRKREEFNASEACRRLVD